MINFSAFRSGEDATFSLPLFVRGEEEEIKKGRFDIRRSEETEESGVIRTGKENRRNTPVRFGDTKGNSYRAEGIFFV